MTETLRIAMWSGPRNISTAMMRSFSSRSDCVVSDEPFYGAFLKSSGEPHPLAAEIMRDMDCDWHTVLNRLSGAAPQQRSIWYQKHMAHHMVGPVDIRDMPGHRHVFLIRTPERVVASYQHKNELREADMLGFARLREYFDYEADRLGTAPVVVDSDVILANPKKTIKRLCKALGLGWESAMLEWPKGPHPNDGIWGPHWYDRVNASTTFGPAPGPPPALDGLYRKVAQECHEDYIYLLRHSLNAD